MNIEVTVGSEHGELICRALLNLENTVGSEHGELTKSNQLCMGLS